MPLRALLDDQPVLAPLCDDEAWEQLRSRAQEDRKAVRMACCAHPALPRRSKLGTKHFAHRPGADCAISDGETVHHLHLKSALVLALVDAGLHADVEVAGDEWRADVLATSAHERIAFEVQWSGQDPQTTLERSRRYARSGVRVVWLMRRRIDPDLAYRRDIICVEVRHPNVGEYRLQLGGRDVTVEEFIGYWTGGAIHLSRRTISRWPPMTAYQFEAACPHCREPVPLVAFAPAPAESDCGLPEREGARMNGLARSALADELRAGRLNAPTLVVHPDRHASQQWKQPCRRCRELITDSWARKTLGRALRADGRSEPLPVFKWIPGEEARPAERYPRHWCLPDSAGGCRREQFDTPREDRSHRGERDRWAGVIHDASEPLTADAIAQRIASQLDPLDELHTTRTPSGCAGSSRTDVALVDLPQRKTALLCAARALDDCEISIWQQRLGAHRKLHVLSACRDLLVGERLDERITLIDLRGHGQWTADDKGTSRDLSEWLAELLGKGRRAQKLLPASVQQVHVATVDLDCWRCGNGYTGVVASGRWRSRCGRPLDSMELWEYATGWCVADAVQNNRLPVRAILERRYSSVVEESGWANVCPRCRAFCGSFYLPAFQDGQRVATLELKLDDVPGSERPSWDGAHHCAYGCA